MVNAIAPEGASNIFKQEGAYRVEEIDQQPDEAGASDLHQEVKEFGDAVIDTVAGSGLQERVESLGMAVSDIEQHVSEWRNWRRGPDLEMFHGLKEQVEAVQAEWESLTTALQAQRERLDTLLRSFPGVVEVSSVKALALRVEHLEQLMGQVLEARRSESGSRTARRQLTVSLVALALTVVLWTTWIGVTLING